MQGYDTISAELEKACAQEPIHLLGTVQPNGFLFAAEMTGGRIVQVSSGIARHWPGLSPDALLGAPLFDWVERAAPGETMALNALPVAQPIALPWRARFERTVPGQRAPPADWKCYGHRTAGDVAVLEWLPQTTSAEQQRTDDGEFSDIAALIARLRQADDINAFFDDCAHVVQRFTGFGRVMIYRFLPDGAGEIIAEQCAADVGQKYLGLRFPASDIPAQARALYLTNRLRMLADVEAVADTLVPPLLPGGAPLDQSHCLLRGLSQVHLSYLRNMGVRATLTMSIVIGGKLWGLIACHHSEPRVPPFEVREALRQLCELTSEVATMRIETLSKLAAVDRRLAMDHLLSQFHQSLLMGEDIVAALRQRLPDFLAAFRADTLGVHINSTEWIGGPGRRHHPARQALTDVLARLDRTGHAPGVLMWDDLLAGAQPVLPALPEAAGMLLAHRFDDHPLFCFVTRPEMLQVVRWAGEPVKEIASAPDGQVRLEPRRSFAEWRQQVKGRSEPWSAVEADGLQSLLQILSEVHKLRVNRTLHEKLHWRAHHDQLTGLYNRRTLEDEVTRRLEDGQFDAALMLLDLDHFKKINDVYGHATGDQVLLQLGRRLAAVIGDGDVLARLGGDEFVLLFQLDRADAASALMFAERLHQSLTTPFDIGGQQLRMGLSIGIALPPVHGRTVTELLRRADLALYHAKAQGRSRSSVFEWSMESDQLDQYLLERDLGEAIAQNELSLVFQPKVDLAARRVVGLEALVRWNHPSRGPTPPAIFIPLAERSDQIVRIDRWVMREALQAQARWRDQGLPTLPVSVNLSMADILSTNVVEYLGALLDEFKMPAGALEVEVTESTVMRELALTCSVLAALNTRGIGTALDDFGTGFSSLSYLRQLPLQCIKIDQSFTLSMLQDPNAETLTGAIVAMGVALKMRVVAEGVETEQQMDWLMEHGCHLGQGFFFSPPVPADDIHAVIKGIELRLAPAPPGLH